MVSNEKDVGLSGCKMLSVGRVVIREILGRNNNGRNAIQQVWLIIQKRRSLSWCGVVRFTVLEI